MSEEPPERENHPDELSDTFKYVIDAHSVLSYGHATNGDGLAVLLRASSGEKILLKMPYAQAGSFLGAVQGATNTAASIRGEKVSREISSALQIRQITLGATQSGRVGFRLGLSNGSDFDLVASRQVVKQLHEALRKYIDYDDLGGPNSTQ